MSEAQAPPQCMGLTRVPSQAPPSSSGDIGMVRVFDRLVAWGNIAARNNNTERLAVDRGERGFLIGGGRL